MASSRTPLSYDGQEATISNLGSVRLATPREIIDGTTNRSVVTPADLNAREAIAFAVPDPIGSTLPNTGTFTILRADSLRVTEGANAKQGTATLVAGTVVVNNTSVTANSRIQLTAQNLGTVTSPSALCVSARTAGTSFTILASQNTDTSTVAYEIFEPA